ncbi:MFS transporter [Streptomyces sp. cg36]|uniref:MFS transporter n=1 Tax=Streptomyces sp. cg36 TaxID=3238798 RepID=UPI0034E22688
MLRSYRDLFSVPGARPLLSAGVVARLPRAMVCLGIITMISLRTGNYALAGAVCATYSLAVATLGPLVARGVDRYGQRRAARAALAFAFLALGVLVGCSYWGAPVWTLFPCALAAGTMPNIGGLARARWAHLFGDTPPLHTAYAAESVADEISFVTGPILAVTLSTAWFPEAGVLAAIGIGLVGTLALTAQRRTEPPASSAHARRPTVLRDAGVRALVLVFCAFGAIFSTVEVITVAFAASHGHRGQAAFALAAFGVTSGVSGLIVGARKLRSSPPVRLAVCLLALAASLVPLPFVGGMTELTLTLLVCGLFISPSLITAYGLIERLVDRKQLNEGLTWLLSGITFGLAVGSLLGGVATDWLGPQRALWVPVACAVATAVLAVVGMRRLSGRRAVPAPADVNPTGDEPAGCGTWALPEEAGERGVVEARAATGPVRAEARPC